MPSMPFAERVPVTTISCSTSIEPVDCAKAAAGRTSAVVAQSSETFLIENYPRGQRRFGPATKDPPMLHCSEADAAVSRPIPFLFEDSELVAVRIHFSLWLSRHGTWRISL
jgi:hypothetical protein